MTEQPWEQPGDVTLLDPDAGCGERFPGRAELIPLVMTIGETAEVLRTTERGVQHLFETAQLRPLRTGRANCVARAECWRFISAATEAGRGNRASSS